MLYLLRTMRSLLMGKKRGNKMTGRLENDFERQRRIYSESTIPSKAFNDKLDSMGYGKKKLEAITDTMYIVKVNESMYVRSIVTDSDSSVRTYTFTNDFRHANQFTHDKTATDDMGELIQSVIDETGGKQLEIHKKIEVIDN